LEYADLLDLAKTPLQIIYRIYISSDEKVLPALLKILLPQCLDGTVNCWKGELARVENGENQWILGGQNA
jgi:hypothetical protein